MSAFKVGDRVEVRLGSSTTVGRIIRIRRDGRIVIEAPRRKRLVRMPKFVTKVEDKVDG